VNIKEWGKAPRELQGWKNYQLSKKLWFGMIHYMKQERPGIKIVLHHVNVNDQHYENWWPVVPMFFDDHLKYHHKSEETRKKISATLTGYKHSDETKIKKSKSSKGRIISDETRKKISEANRGNKYNLGKHYSEEHKQKISESHKGKVFSEGHKRNLSISNKGKTPWNKGKKLLPLTENHKNKISESHKGKKWTNEQKEKYIKSRTGLKLNCKSKFPNRYCVDCNKEISRYISNNVNGLCKKCLGKRNRRVA
jgi:hypothetical protein